MMMGLFAGTNNQRIEFVRMKGPQGKGHAEMAVTKPKGKTYRPFYKPYTVLSAAYISTHKIAVIMKG